MTKDEALKLALEALDGLSEPYDVLKAQDAIKEALAQPEQDGKCKYCTDGCPACDARKLPEQERFLVATIGNWGRVEWADGVFPSLGDKMYSAPRTWVGLTDEEILDKCESVPDYDIGNHDLIQFARSIEAALKAKNT